MTFQQEPVAAVDKPPNRPAAAEDSSGSTAKALRILEAVADDGRPVSIAELSAMLRLSKPTAHRIGTALESLGYLEREPGSRRFIEGKRLVQLALKVLRAAAARGPRHGILKSLSETIGETCNTGVMSGTEVVYLDRVEAAWPLGLRFEPGSRVPLHCTSLGKLFLSHLPEDQLRGFISALPLRRYTQNTITARTASRPRSRRSAGAVSPSTIRSSCPGWSASPCRSSGRTAGFWRAWRCRRRKRA